MSERCNKCKLFSLITKFCRKDHKDAHSRDHICREFKPLKPETPK